LVWIFVVGAELVETVTTALDWTMTHDTAATSTDFSAGTYES